MYKHLTDQSNSDRRENLNVPFLFFKKNPNERRKDCFGRVVNGVKKKRKISRRVQRCNILSLGYFGFRSVRKSMKTEIIQCYQSKVFTIDGIGTVTLFHEMCVLEQIRNVIGILHTTNYQNRREEICSPGTMSLS